MGVWGKMNFVGLLLSFSQFPHTWGGETPLQSLTVYVNSSEARVNEKFEWCGEIVIRFSLAGNFDSLFEFFGRNFTVLQQSQTEPSHIKSEQQKNYDVITYSLQISPSPFPSPPPRPFFESCCGICRCSQPCFRFQASIHFRHVALL